MPRTLIIGDVHGCYDELQALLDKAALASDDQIISIGDMVDRGPKSPEALDFFRDTTNAGSILGNHERKHIRAYRGQIDPAASQVIARRQIGDEAYPAAIAYMETLPQYLDLAEATLVHAFWEPGIPLAQQKEMVIVGVTRGEQYLQEKGWWPWYEYYDGDKPLVVGHRDYSDVMQPFVYQDRVFGLDSRCVYGGSLTGLLLPDFKLISVPSRGDHWKNLQQHYAGVLFNYDAS